MHLRYSHSLKLTNEFSNSAFQPTYPSTLLFKRPIDKKSFRFCMLFHEEVRIFSARVSPLFQAIHVAFPDQQRATLVVVIWQFFWG